MNKRCKQMVAALCAGAVFISSAAAASIGSFSDAAGHWAYASLSRAVDDGLLAGADGKLMPDGSLTGAQMAAILNRVVVAQDTSRTYPNTPAGAWYTADAAKSASLGVLPYDGSLNLRTAVTRAQVFPALTAAFGLDEVTPDDSVLRVFSDADTLTPAQRRAAAVLVRMGVLSGSQDGTLQAARGITRAEFVALIYRIWNGQVNPQTMNAADDTSNDSIDNIAPEQPDAVQPDMTAQTDDDASGQPDLIDENTDPSDVLDGDDISASDESLMGRGALLLYTLSPDRLPGETSAPLVVLRGQNMTSAFAETGADAVNINRLVLATTGSRFTLSNPNGNTYGTVVVGGGTSPVTINAGTTKRLEVTGYNRVINLCGVQLDSLMVSGSGNQIIADSNTSIGTLRVLSDAAASDIIINGTLKSADVAGSYTSLSGSGRAEHIFVTGKRCATTLAADNLDNSKVDDGLEGIQVKVTAPNVAPGGQITATATVSGVSQSRICSAQWYLDGQADNSFVNHSFALENGKTSSYSKKITFSRYMALEHTVGFVISYQNSVTGETEKIVAGATVQIQNYPDSHYQATTEQDVLNKVNPTYRRGNTDYTSTEKTIFVNAKGYSSQTQYLLWVSRSAQKVNVFEGSQGNWKLIHVFDCATGAASTPTPVGVTYVTYKQTNWTTENYTCRPIVRFYPNTGYAFHSRLYYPNTNKLKDASMGFPVSHGCVRMMDEGINWIYNNVPVKTTVVIY